MSTAIPVPDDWRPFFSSWDEIRHGYHAGDRDEAVRDCADRLDATWPGSGSDPVLFRTLGMLLLAPYVAFGSPGTGAEDRAVAVLRRVARGGDGRVCAHGWHPYEADVDEVLERLPAFLDRLAPRRSRPSTTCFPRICFRRTIWTAWRTRRPNRRTSPGPRSSPAGSARVPYLDSPVRPSTTWEQRSAEGGT